MMINKILLLLFLTSLLNGCNQEKEEINTSKFSGLWSVYIMEEFNSETGEWSEWRSGIQGYILYDEKNNMSVHLTTKGYEDTQISFPNFTDSISHEVLKHLTNSYVYFAKYKVYEEQGIVEHARISHSNPAEWNEVVKRRYGFSGDTLILQPLEEENAGLRLKWIKQSGQTKEITP
ncbi:MAG: lipocalin-like domain-containing protein [Cyclobacteriaceae bacterium]|nr:lipocalin-like domain-containing protein [Cyclobacteriaceae bacterium]